MSRDAGADRNLFAALRARFPANLDAIAVQPADAQAGTAPAHTWRELDEASARIANLLDSLGLPPGARVAAQTEKSVEALILYLAVLRAGRVFLPLNTAYQASEIAYFLKDAEPAMVVCSGRAFAGVSEIARQAGIASVFSLNEDRTGTLLESAASTIRGMSPRPCTPTTSPSFSTPAAPPAGARGPCSRTRTSSRTPRRCMPTGAGARGDVLMHALPIFHVHGLFVAAQGALFSGSKMLWFNRFDARAIVQAAAGGERVHGRSDTVRAHAPGERPHPGGVPAHAPLHGGLRSPPARYVRSVA